jgi:hemerythrin
MSIDQGIIDEDHRHLIDIINRLNSDATIADALGVLEALRFYTDVHFAREELLQGLVGFSEPNAHHARHRELLSTLEQIKTLAGTVDMVPRAAAAMVEELRALLRRWLLRHIIGDDLKMKVHAEALRHHAAQLPGVTTQRRRARRRSGYEHYVG